MSEENIISLDPWNSKNHLLTEDHVYTILEKAGFSMQSFNNCYRAIYKNKNLMI